MNIINYIKENKVISVLIFLVAYLLYQNNFCKKSIEKMSNTDESIIEAVNKVYRADINAIRNLAEISKKLQEGKLTIPGNLTVEGDLKVSKKINSEGDITSKGKLNSNSLNVNGSSKVNSLEVVGSADFGTGSKRKLKINSTAYDNTGTYISFHDGDTRLGYIIPNTSKKLNISGMELDYPNAYKLPFNPSDLVYKNKNYKIKHGCHELIYTSRINPSNPWMSSGCKRYAGFDKSGDSFQIV